MSDKTYFQIYYGEGEIRYGQFGVDLSGFRSVTKGLDRATERPFRSVYNWFMKCFKLDDDECELRISAVTTRTSSPVYWELVTIDNTTFWKRFVDVSLRRGLPLILFVQAYEKVNVEAQSAQVYDDATVVEQVVENNVNELNEIGDDEQGEGSQTVREPMGEVEESEEIPGLVEQMQREDTEGDVRDDDDSDHEDDRPVQVPSQWNNYDHSQLLVNEGETVPWEYSENEVSVGAIYHSKIELKEAVQRWSAKCLKKEFRVVKSSPQVYDVKCIRDDCPFRVHAYMGKYDTFWTVSKIEHHTCILEELEGQHRNLTADFVAQYMYSKIVNNPGYEVKAIINSIEDDFQYKITYSKAYRAKQKALEMRWGAYEASYHNLPRVLNTLCERNPGSYFEIEHYNLPHDPTKHVLQRAFFVLGACINAFQYCRPVIYIDGTFLTGRYKGTMLTAIAADGNNQVLPLAFAFVESENGDSWYWFLERIKSCIVQDRRDVCVIHDRHGGIMQAVQDLQEGSVQRQRTPKWVDLKSRWCMRHMGANFQKQFKSKKLTTLFKRLCSQNQEKKFNVLWKKLDEHTKKQAAELRSRGVNAEDEEPIAMENVGVDGPNVRRRPGRLIKSFSEWIEHEPKEKWALLHDEGGARYGIMTTNLAEVYNWVLHGSRTMAAPQGYVTPELLDAATDRKHRSYFSAVLGCSLGQFRARVPMETMVLDPRWLPRLRTSGLLPLARLVEGERPRFSYDFSLLAALVDRWRPETHTLYLTVGEMAPTLQDVSYLLGLPLRGDAMGPTDVGQGWRDDLLDRFGRVQRRSTAQAYREFAPTHTGGPPKWWILQFKADDIRVGATEYEVARHLEAYVLCLMGWVMFCSSAGSFVPKHLLPFARYVADGPLEAIPQFSWGSAFTYAHVQTRKSYPDFVGQFDVLRDDEVRWEPYSVAAVGSRAPEGLSPLCVRDAEYWRTRSPLVFDIYVEEHAVHRVLRQLGLFQEIVVPRSLLPPHVHRFVQTMFTRQGQSVGQLWAPRLAEFVAKWTTALDHVVLEGRPHDDAAWGLFLRWYLPRTRVRVLPTPQELPRRTPSVTDSYLTQRDQGASLAVSFFTDCRLLIETHRSLYFLAN
ncbi:hypothetical protein U9M48_035264 [Paspalum notatum var. saurae]|uniref:Mutator-like transposase n=1 Tax=Paspalum notatum var. saurae TaxID=547442 RepID=A0AAQ3UEV0_PASNO